LINGAAGGVGTFAVQIAKSFGATVTGVCSTRNVEMVSEIGADEVPLFMAKLSKEDLVILQGLLEAGKVKLVIDRTYPLSETAEAIRYLELGHARGKVVITV